MRARPPRWLRVLLTEADLEAVAASVTAAEARTSGEIRLHLEPRVSRRRAPLERAQELFAQLGMHATRDRNGVLIYVAVKDRKLAVIGDQGVHERVGAIYWERLRDLMIERLRRGASREALVAAVEDVGRVLAEHFPRRPDDVDELSNEVSTGA